MVEGNFPLKVVKRYFSSWSKGPYPSNQPNSFLHLASKGKVRSKGNSFI